MSEGRSPTPEQAAAIGSRGRRVLIEAGAGTGKTGVMVDRYCRLACDEGVPLDAILAFTFTDRAAAELRQRIRAELSRRAAGGSERARLLLAEVGGAWVTTIHGFCNRLLAGHPVAAGIDPRFRVLDVPEAERVAREAFDEALGEFLAGRKEPREATVAAFGIDGLRALVGDAHAELRSRGVAAPTLPAPPPSDPGAAIRRAAEAAAAAAAELKPDDPRREAAERAAVTLGAAAGKPPPLDELATLRIGGTAKNTSEYRETIEAAIARVAEAGEGGEAYRHLAALIELFSGRFEDAKRRRGAVDFEDLQILAARLLEQTEIGEAHRGRFRHLMVDEFQDTNRLQLRLIEALRGPRTELMVVGDELQSIYGFRHADLDVFREQRRLIEADPDGEAMKLSGNFRSRPELIGAVNALGDALLGGSFRPLRVGVATPPVPPGKGPAVELLLTARDGWDGEGIELEPAIDDRTPLSCLAEARFVAERLRALADAGVARGEMVVLLRAFTHLDAYENALERAGLRPYVVGGRGYWSQQQVADVCALLATIANPLDDRALFGALASPACGVAPDTLWLLRAAAGGGHPIWPAVERAVGMGEVAPAEPAHLEQIAAADLALLRRFAETVTGLRELCARLSLAALIEAAVADTGYDLAVLMRAGGEARFANVRKLMRLAAEFESREGRDLRGLLDFLAARSETGAEAQAATAAEGHDGVRIMTVHNAKGLEFGVVAVPDLSRSLLAGSRAPLLTLGRGDEPQVGLRLLRLGAASVDLFDYAELCEEEKRRDSEEGLRLFHVAATRAREHLLLSGVVRPEDGRNATPGTPIIERIVEAFGIDREADSLLPVDPPQPRAGLEASFRPSEIAVRVNLPSPERAAELAVVRREAGAARSPGEGPPPLVERRPPVAPRLPLSYSAISAYEEAGLDRRRVEGAPEDGAARGAAVHHLLEWSANNDWREPPPELARRFALSDGLDRDSSSSAGELLALVRAWLASDIFEERVRRAEHSRAEVPILLQIAGTVMRGSIDLLVEGDRRPPLIVDYKTDRLDGTEPIESVGRYDVQRDIYALAASEALGSREIEVAYVFLERPGQPVVQSMGPDRLKAARGRIEATIEEIEGL